MQSLHKNDTALDIGYRLFSSKFSNPSHYYQHTSHLYLLIYASYSVCFSIPRYCIISKHNEKMIERIGEIEAEKSKELYITQTYYYRQNHSLVTLLFFSVSITSARGVSLTLYFSLSHHTRSWKIAKKRERRWESQWIRRKSDRESKERKEILSNWKRKRTKFLCPAYVHLPTYLSIAFTFCNLSF